MATTYAINTKTGEFRTTSARSAASVAVTQRKNGLDPSAYAVVDLGAGVSVRKVEILRTVTQTAKALAAASR